MKRIWTRNVLTLVLLVSATLLLVGCPKKPAPTAAVAPPGAGPVPGPGPSGAGAAGESGTGAGSAPGVIGSSAGTVAGGLGAGGTGTGPAGAASPGGPGVGPGAASATGTTVPALPAPRQFVETSALRDVHFDFDRYDVRPQGASVLKQNADWLKANPSTLLLVEGHADERGTNEYNLALGERRAKTTRDYLVSLGIEAARITIITYGEERPVCAERTEACWARNRRAHFLVKP